MKLEEAIENGEKELEDTFVGTEERWKATVKILLEAGKYAQRDRRGLSDIEIELLPGETKD